MKTQIFKFMGFRVERERVHRNLTNANLGIKNKNKGTYSEHLQNTTSLTNEQICEVLVDLTISMMYAKCVGMPLERTHELCELRIYDTSLKYLDTYYAREFDKILSKYTINSESISDMWEVLICSARGSYYTPSQITKYMTNDAIETYVLKKYNSINNTNYTALHTVPRSAAPCVHDILANAKICDPCVGTGNFVFSLFDTFCDIYDNFNIEYEKPKLILDILKNNLYTIEYNDKTINIYRLRLMLILRKYGVTDFEWNTFCGDSSNYEDWNKFLGYRACANKMTMSICEDYPLEFSKVNEFVFTPFFDIVIANPPYIRKHGGLMLDKFKYYFTYNYNLNLCWYIFEVLVNLTKPGGVLHFIMFHKVHEYSATDKTRVFILNKLNFAKCIEWSILKGFKNTNVSTAIYKFIKNEPQGDIKYARINDLAKLSNEGVLIDLPARALNPDRFLLTYETPRIEVYEFIKKTCTNLLNFGYTNHLNTCHGIDPFVLNEEQKMRILDRCTSQEERDRTAKVIKPLLKYVGAYSYIIANKDDLFFINVCRGFPNYKNSKSKEENEHDFKTLYPSLYEHMLAYKEYLVIIKKRNKVCASYSWYEILH